MPAAVALSSIGFGVAHASGDSLPLVELAFGVLAALGYVATGRLAVPVAMHALVNGTALLVEAPEAIPGHRAMSRLLGS